MNWSGRPLASHVAGRDNNFNLIRMLAACGVLVSHAFPISLGYSAKEPLEDLLHGMTLGAVSVMVFFGISGFLIARSFDRSSNLMRFFRARVLRLFPALMVVLAITVLVAGVWLNPGNTQEYWRAVPAYMAGNLSLYFLKYDLPGVFIDNPNGPAINGSLWTLNHEVTCYLGIVGLGLVGALTNRTRMAAMVAAFIAFYAATIVFEPHRRLILLAQLAWPFWVGTILYVWRDQVELSLRLGLLLALLAFGSYFTPLFREMFVICLVYWTYIVAYLPGGPIRLYNRLGDYSYGVYVYAFPVQQFLVDHLGPITPVQNMAMALPIVLGCAVLSWKLIESPALALAAGGGQRPATKESGPRSS